MTKSGQKKQNQNKKISDSKKNSGNKGFQFPQFMQGEYDVEKKEKFSVLALSALV